MKTIIIATFNGHINSEGFNSWEEARVWVESRIPKDAKHILHSYTNADGYWNCLQYEDERDNKYLWQLTEITIKEDK